MNEVKKDLEIMKNFICKYSNILILVSDIIFILCPLYWMYGDNYGVSLLDFGGGGVRKNFILGVNANEHEVMFIGMLIFGIILRLFLKRVKSTNSL
tara:strand:+ start:328 stop:615 length:288 start_codon:yes stop_codon:yes gene_type:complete